MISDVKIPDTTEEVLEMALEMEEEGYQTYIEGAKYVKNSLGKRMLERLARDELDHKKRIREVYKALKGKKNLNEVKMSADEEGVTFQSIFNRLRKELSQSIEELGSYGVDDEEIIETAINLENHAKFYYSEAAKKTVDQKTKDFLEILAKEEEGHYNALRNINTFLSDPSNWFATQGKF